MRRPGFAKLVLVPALALVAGLAGGCGYSTGIRVGDRVRSLGITFFDNKTLERDVERSVQNALTAAVRELTDVRLTDPADAEVVMRGVVMQFIHRGGIRSPENMLLETGLFIEVEAGLYDRQSGRPLGPQQRAGTWVGYVTDETGAEAIAQERIVRYIAEELVLDLFARIE